MSIIARALQKAQKEREQRLRRQEEELRKAKEAAAAKLAAQKQPRESKEPQENKDASAISEGLKLSTEQQAEIAVAEATLKAEAAPKKKSLLPHILIGGIIFLFIGMAGVLYIWVPALQTSQPKPSKTTAPRTAAMKKPSRRTIAPAPAIEENIPEPVPAVKQQIFYGANDPSDLPIVSGIMYSPVNPQAIVNGVMVSKGDVVNGFTIREINPSTVTVSYGEKQYELRLR
ncbi:hypothetical protein ACFL5E_01070 [Candidatus Omnitrophota bacterium]